MAKQKTRGGGRGGARGGRGSTRGGRGGKRGSGSRGRGRGGSRGRGGRGPSRNDMGYPELMDLNEGSMNMKSLSKRPGRLMDEVEYTQKHSGETFNKPLRNNPIVFVKAKEMDKKVEKVEDEVTIDDKLQPEDELEEELEEEIQEEYIEEFIEEVQKEVNEEVHEDHDLEITRPTQDEEIMDHHVEKHIQISPENQVLLDLLNVPKSSNHHPPVIFTSDEEDISENEVPHADLEQLSINEVAANDIVKELYTTNEAAEVSLDNSSKPSVTKKTGDDFIEDLDLQPELEVDEPKAKLELDEPNTESIEGLDFIIDTEADSNFKLPKPNMSSIINSKRIIQTDEISFSKHDDEIPSLEHDVVLNIGKVSLRTVTDSRGNITTELEENKKTRGFADRTVNAEKEIVFAGYREYIKQVMKRMDESDEDVDDDSDESMEWDEIDEDANLHMEVDESDSDSGSNSDQIGQIEYGFLPEDYEFDVSQISITNVRFGIKNQFYTRNLELTGSIDEHIWVDEEELIDFVISKGVKEHRLSSFLKYVTGGLSEMAQPDEPDYSDVHISDSSSEEEEEEVDYGDDIEALVALSKQQQLNSISAHDMYPTRSIQTKGKGRRKHLDVDGVDLDVEIRQSLQDQFQIRRTSKKQKKLDHANSRLEEGLRKHDLLVKYPYSILVSDIRTEFELLLHDGGRDSLSFPPLDPHGNKTLCKFAKCYNMKAMKCGNKGLKSFIKVSKNKKTFHYLPNYNEIGYMLKQRPIFNRTDQRRPKDEIVETDGNFKKDKARGRNKPSSNAEIREGDIVGAKAPEIRHDNFGRLMLERLGWVKGEGLGALGNKGISEPVMATVKKSKTGLRTTSQDNLDLGEDY